LPLSTAGREFQAALDADIIDDDVSAQGVHVD
jgi:hypothetical protein